MITLTPNGLYCAQADIYIDPIRRVDRAIITHAHADHARPGMKHYLCHDICKPILKARLGSKISVDSKAYGETFTINGVSISLHNAAHILGSAQIRLAYKNQVWVVSGDYKTTDDGLSGAFETVKCTHFISECTFGLPIYQFPTQEKIKAQINQWIAQNMADGYHSVLLAYSIGKAQRLLHLIDDQYMDQIIAHGSVQKMNDTLIEHGIELKRTKTANDSKEERGKPQIIIAPPNVRESDWFKKFKPARFAFSSGWMQSATRRNAHDVGFILSDHADWNGLRQAIAGTQAENIYFTHGSSEVMARYAREELKLNGQELEILRHDHEC